MKKRIATILTFFILLSGCSSPNNVAKTETVNNASSDTSDTLVNDLQPEEVSVPNFVGMDIDTARVLAEKHGIYLDVYYETDSKKPSGEIVYQNAEAHSVIPMWSSINVIVSEGEDSSLAATTEITTEPSDMTLLMPNFVGRQFNDTLQNRYSMLVFDAEYDYSDDFSEGIIFYQDIPENTMISSNTVIHIKVSIGPKDSSVILDDAYDEKQQIVIDRMKQNVHNPMVPVTMGDDDVLCIVNEYELHIKVEEKFSGDVYSFGVRNVKTDEWVVPYNTESELINSKVKIDEIMEAKNKKNIKIYDVGNNIIYYDDYYSGSWGYSLEWCYDFINDRLIYLYSGSKLIPYTQNIINTTSDFIYSNMEGLTRYDLNTGEHTLLVECEPEVADDNWFFAQKYNKDIKQYNYYVYDYEGNILLKVSDDYSLDYHWFRYQYMDYSNGYLLSVAYGKDSGNYLCLFNKDGEIINEPNKIEETTSNNDYIFYLFDDFYVIINLELEKGEITNIRTEYYDYNGNEI